MIRLTTLLLVLASAAPLLAADPKDAPDPVLVELQSKLEQELRDVKPAPTFEIPAGREGKTLVMRYKTREYQVHKPLPKGRWSNELHTEIGPDDEGVVLHVSVQFQNTFNQLVAPQRFREPYWDTYLNDYPVADTDKEIRCFVSSRPTTDKKLLERIHKVLAGKE